MLEAYRSLALKWRPKAFDEVVNQQVPTTILRNALRSKNIFPSMVFYGSAGSGKTSLARIYAKALNCESFDNDICGKCDSCKNFSEGSLCYIEQDAASNGNVDDVHSLLKKLRYEVPGVPYRVVCLDECQMMSTAAWNAMLKIVEEPPPHVIFIFVTTEIRKVPEPVLSRCFALPFKRIALDEIVGRLKQIAEVEGISVGDDVITAIARRSEGKLRDAVTLLEQLWIMSEGRGVTDDILSLVGVCGQDVYANLIELVVSGKVEEGLDLFRSWVTAMGPNDFLKGLEDYLHKLFLKSNGIAVSVVEPRVKVTWGDTVECMGKVWGMMDVVRTKYSQARLENLLTQMLLRFRVAGQDGPVEKNPPPLQETECQRPSFSVSNGSNGNGSNGVGINKLSDFKNLWQDQG